MQDLTWMIHKVDGMPSSIRVGNSSLCILLSIPWLPREVVPSLLEVFYINTMNKATAHYYSFHVLIPGLIFLFCSSFQPATESQPCFASLAGSMII